MRLPEAFKLGLRRLLSISTDDVTLLLCAVPPFEVAVVATVMVTTGIVNVAIVTVLLLRQGCPRVAAARVGLGLSPLRRARPGATSFLNQLECVAAIVASFASATSATSDNAGGGWALSSRLLRPGCCTGTWDAVGRHRFGPAAAARAASQKWPGATCPHWAKVRGWIDANGQFAPRASSATSVRARPSGNGPARAIPPRRAALVAPLGGGETRKGAALGARPIPWTPPRAPTAPLSAAPPPAAASVSCPCRARRRRIVAAALTSRLGTAETVAASQRLQKALLLRVLLAKCLQNLAKLSLAAAAAASAMGCACAPWTAPAAHWRRRGVVRGQQVRCRGHPEEGARGAALASRSAMPRRFASTLRRGDAAGPGPPGGPRR